MNDMAMVTVKVEFVLEVRAGGWSGECKLEQVMKQSQDAARKAVEKVLRDTGPLMRCVKIGPPSIHMPGEQQKP